MPVPMPVDQTGENILFVVDGDFVEAHIQIQYDGDAERFAWVVPVPAVPEIEIGSGSLIQALAAASSPVYVRTDIDTCGGDGDGDGDGDGGGGGSGFIPSPDAGGPPDPDVPDVVWQDTVGSFEVAVLQGGTAEEVVKWLDANGYAQDDEAVPVLQEYLDEGFLFAAFKLEAAASVSEIHPVIVRYPGTEPCVPLRLTRIAAVEDMQVNVHFLDEERWTPENYRHVVLNSVKVDWDFVNATYSDVLSQAVDEADGHAFVTDYAGPSAVVDATAIWSDRWDPDAFVGMPLEQLIPALNAQALTACYSWGCEPLHPLVFPILEKYLPPPDGIDKRTFWGALDQYLDQVDLAIWDDTAFAADLQELVAEPGLHAKTLLASSPYLTRMSTSISPHEMTLDPIFHRRDDLGDVALVRSATRTLDCDRNRSYELGEGRSFCVDAGAGYPTFAGMPFADRIESIPATGAPQVLTNNRSTTLDQLAAYRKTACGGDGSEDDSTGGTPGADDDQAPAGCGCSLPNRDTPWPWALALVCVGAGGIRRRR